MMAIGEGCYEECYGDFMTTGGGDYGTAVGRNDYDYSMGLVEFAEVLTSLLQNQMSQVGIFKKTQSGFDQGFSPVNMWVSHIKQVHKLCSSPTLPQGY